MAILSQHFELFLCGEAILGVSKTAKCLIAKYRVPNWPKMSKCQVSRKCIEMAILSKHFELILLGERAKTAKYKVGRKIG